MKRYILLAAAVLTLGFAPLAVPQSATPAYTVEIVIFRASAPDASIADAAGNPGAGNIAGAGQEGAATGRASAQLIATLPRSELQLGGVAARLRSSGPWQPLAHVAWRQTPSSWGSRSGLTLAQLGADAPGLSGLVYLERGQYLHVGFTVTWNGATINEIRRVRLNEKNYFDNPAFGIIAVVSPAAPG